MEGRVGEVVSILVGFFKADHFKRNFKIRALQFLFWLLYASGFDPAYNMNMNMNVIYLID